MWSRADNVRGLKPDTEARACEGRRTKGRDTKGEPENGEGRNGRTGELDRVPNGRTRELEKAEPGNRGKSNRVRYLERHGYLSDGNVRDEDDEHSGESGEDVLRSFRDLDFYRDAYQLALEVHRLTLTFPGWERHELGSQMRNASKRIAAVIAEGWGRREHPKEFQHFLTIAAASGEEMQVHLEFCRDLGYLEPDVHTALAERYQSVIRRVVAFSKRWERW